ncbi:MAG: hypothetical protein AB1540_09825 [Bdellovibrionota bacterium]
MEWISSLLKSVCPFCELKLGDARRACLGCSRLLSEIEQEPAIYNRLGDMVVVSAAYYESWMRNLILRQKQKASSLVVSWMADFLHQKVPLEWRGIDFLWVPAHSLASMHLVEHLVWGLHQKGIPMVRRAYLSRKTTFFEKPQKKLDLSQRRTRSIEALYKLRRLEAGFSQPLEIILFDDILTTGNTLTGLKKMIEEHGRFKIRGALTLAFTKRLQPSEPPNLTKQTLFSDPGLC